MNERTLELHELAEFQTTALEIAHCDRLEIIVPLFGNETAGTRPDTWPQQVRAAMEVELGAFVGRTKGERVIRAVTYGAPKIAGGQNCVVVVHHEPKASPSADASTTAETDNDGKRAPAEQGCMLPSGPPASPRSCSECG